MNAWIQHELFWNRMMRNLIRVLFLTGYTVMTLMFIIITGSVIVDGFGATTGFHGSHRDEVLAYGCLALFVITFLTNGAVLRLGRNVWREIDEAHDRQVSGIYRASRASPEYYRDPVHH